MQLILSRCDKCKKAYLKENYKTTEISYTRFGSGQKSFDLCDTCLDELISSMSDEKGDLPLYIPGD